MENMANDKNEKKKKRRKINATRDNTAACSVYLTDSSNETMDARIA